MGANCSAVTSPSWTGDPVSSRTSHAWPTLCIQVPISETSCPPQKSRKSRCRSAARRAGFGAVGGSTAGTRGMRSPASSVMAAECGPSAYRVKRYRSREAAEINSP